MIGSGGEHLIDQRAAPQMGATTFDIDKATFDATDHGDSDGTTGPLSGPVGLAT